MLHGFREPQRTCGKSTANEKRTDRSAVTNLAVAKKSPGRRLCQYLAITGLMIAAGCGKQGDPLPPLRYIPATTQDLNLHQQGNLLSFRMTYPQATATGQKLPGIELIEVYRLVAPVSDASRPPQIDERTYQSTAERLLTLRGPELQAAIVGDRIETRLPNREVLEGTELQAFAVRSVSTTGEASELSNIVSLVLSPPVSPPVFSAATATATGVELTWTAGEGDVVGYNVYRRPADVRGYGEPIERITEAATTFLDRSARYGQRYFYTLRSVFSTTPLVESSPAADIEIDYQDRFAPAAPTGLLGLPEDGQVRLVWAASADTDTVGYLVYRADPASDFRALTSDPIADLEYVDSGLAAGVEFRYRVTAVDGVGNEGAPGDEVRVAPE